MAESDLTVSGIYAIRNTSNGKMYVGSTACMKIRKIWHFSALRSSRHHSNRLQKAWNKYGEQNFSFIILEIVDDVSLLVKREQFWIDTTKSSNRKIGYNTCPTAGSVRGVTLSDEHKEKIRSAHKGRKKSPDHRAKIAQRNKSNGPATTKHNVERWASLSLEQRKILGRKIGDARLAKRPPRTQEEESYLKKSRSRLRTANYRKRLSQKKKSWSLEKLMEYEARRTAMQRESGARRRQRERAKRLALQPSLPLSS